MVRLVIYLLVCSFFTGCSWLNEFFVFNATGTTIALRYSEGVNYNSGNSVTSPKAYAITSWENSVPQLGDTVSVYCRIEHDTVRYVELPTNTALVLMESINKDLRSDSACKMMLSQFHYLEAQKPNDGLYICHGAACFSDLVKINRSRAGIKIR